MNDEKHESNTTLEPNKFLKNFKKNIKTIAGQSKRTQILLNFIIAVVFPKTPLAGFKEIDDFFQENAGEIEKMKLLNRQLLASWTKLGAAFDEVKLKGEGLADG